MWRMWGAALFWGLNWTAAKIVLTAISPWALRAAGLSAGGALLTVIARATKVSLAIPRGQWCHMVVAPASPSATGWSVEVLSD